MDLYEYQARDIFASHGVPVKRGIVVTDFEQAQPAARELQPYPVVVKAQVKTGGRGKAGGVKLAFSAEEARANTRAILGLDIKGHRVKTVMISAGVDIAEEYYFSILLDRARRAHVALCSRVGGMDIESLAVENPQALVQYPLDPARGIDIAVALEILSKAGFEPDDIRALAPVLVKLWQVYRDQDATLVEVNPLVKSEAGEIIALDAKMTLDDNARFRHPEHAGLVDVSSEDPLEVAAGEAGLNYVRLNGQVGIIGNGAGLVMSTLDVVALAGEPYGIRPANFLDIGGGASAEVMASGMRIILGDPQVKSVFVNVFGGITACDAVASGILGALEQLGDEVAKPIVVRLDGNQVEAGRQLLRVANHPQVTLVETMDQAAQVAAEFAAGIDSVKGER